MPISDWPLEERPREKLLAKGATALSDGELIAVLLSAGVRGKSAVDLARDLLTQSGGMTHMLEAGAELETIKGLGPAKRAQFAAAIELARRSLQEKLKENAALTSPGAVRDYLRLKLASRKEEAFVCIWLDAQHKAIEFEVPFTGTLTQTSVYPREIVKAALRVNAAAVIFAQNHPPAAAQPSQADELLTRNLKEALALVEVKVLDHFIVAGNQAISFAERGLLKPALFSRNPAMSRVCQVTGKKPMKGHLVSHANNKTIRSFQPNLHYRRFWLESQSRWVRLRVSTSGLRRIDKLGLEPVLAEIKARKKP